MRFQSQAGVARCRDGEGALRPFGPPRGGPGKDCAAPGGGARRIRFFSGAASLSGRTRRQSQQPDGEEQARRGFGCRNPARCGGVEGDSTAIEESIIEVGSGAVERAAESRAQKGQGCQIAADEVRIREIRASYVRVAQGRRVQIRIAEIRTPQVRETEVRSNQICIREVGPDEIGISEVDGIQIGPLQIHPHEIELRSTQGGLQVDSRIGMDLTRYGPDRGRPFAPDVDE